MPTKAETKPEVYGGMRVEVSTMNGTPLFGGKITYWQGTQATLDQFPVPFGPLPEESTFKAQLRGYNDRTGKAVLMEGVISAKAQRTWEVTELKIIRTGNERAFFRLETSQDAVMSILGRGFHAGEHPCKMLNISIGGVCVRTDLRQHEDDKFLLKVQLMEEREVSLMFCQIVRVTDNGDGTFSYGCRFLELTENDETRITQNIFAAQRKMRGGQS